MIDKASNSTKTRSSFLRLVKQKLTSAPITPLTIAALATVPILAVLFSLIPIRPSLWSDLWATTLPDYVGNSILLMVLTGVIASAIGIGAAWCVTMLKFPGRKTLSWLLILPLASPAYIISYVYVDLLEFYGPLQSGLRSLFGLGAEDYSFPPIRTLPGAAFILGLVLYPYIYLMARSAFSLQSMSQWQAARSLGLTPRQAFWRVALPAARPGIIAGLALVLMETLADFGVADYFGIPTLSTGIFRNWLAGGDKDAAMKLAAVMLFFVFLLTLFEAWNRKGKAETVGKTAKQAVRIELDRKTKWAVTGLCAVPVILGFAVPVLRLLYNAVQHTDAQTKDQFFKYAFNSLTVALTVSILTVLIAIVLSYAQRKTNSKLTKISIRLSTFGYALPGALLAVGLLAPIGIFDQSLTRFVKAHSSWSGGLILSGTIALLVYALTIRFLTVAFNALSSGFEKIPTSMDAAARSLGAKPLSLIRRIHIPLLSQSLLVAIILVFIDVLRELPATLILRPFNFDTLATRIYWLASDERLIEASTAALAIIIMGLIPVILLNRKLDT